MATHTGSRRGYALLEALIALVLVVALGLTVTPPLIDDLREGKIARAQAEAQLIGQAVQEFHRDVGHWPGGTVDGGSPWIRLVGNAGVGGGTVAVPKGARLAELGAPAGAQALTTVSAHLIRNEAPGGEPLYRPSRHPYLEPGWNGPYLEEVPLDPWGHSYMVTVIRDPAAAGQGEDAELVLVVSAGPDGVLQTPLDAAPRDGRCQGDDVGLLVERPEPPIL